MVLSGSQKLKASILGQNQNVHKDIAASSSALEKWHPILASLSFWKLPALLGLWLCHPNLCFDGHTQYLILGWKSALNFLRTPEKHEAVGVFVSPSATFNPEGNIFRTVRT